MLSLCEPESPNTTTTREETNRRQKYWSNTHLKFIQTLDSGSETEGFYFTSKWRLPILNGKNCSGNLAWSYHKSW